jgi:hypothetical protein
MSRYFVDIKEKAQFDLAKLKKDVRFWFLMLVCLSLLA